MVRNGMVELVARLKRLTDIGNNTQDGFNDEDVQSYLDQNKIVYENVELIPTVTRQAGNTISYFNYPLPDALGDWFELPEDDAINEAFYLVDYQYAPVLFGDGDNQATFDPNIKRIIFNSDTFGVTYFLNVQSYDLYGAAADIWSDKLAARTGLIDIKTDNHTLGMSKEYDHIKERYLYYLGLSRKTNDSKMIRVDQMPAYTETSVRGFMPVGSY